MAKLPKSLIKKYGISKKAWAIFRKGKKSKSRAGVKKTMAKKTVKRRKSSSSNAKMKQATKILAGATLAALYEVFVSPMIPFSRNVKNLLEIGIGIALLFSRNMYVKSAGIALITINAFEIVVPMIQKFRNKGSVAVATGNVDAFLQ